MTELEIAEQLLAMGIDAPTVLEVYSWGFGAVLGAWTFGYAIGVVIDTIRKA